jgi:formate dehydrogenase major subunit
MVNLIIDGKPVQVPDGTTVLQAAQSAGIHIPTLCHHPALKPFGGCRLCLVEVEGARTLQPSCTLPASEKMNVLTTTDKVKAARKFVLTLIFSDRNHFCPYCQVSGGDCELQNAALDEGMSHWPFQPNWQHFQVDASHDYYVMDHNRCILCQRCVRACGQLVGNFTLGIEERGASSMLVADTGVPLGESTCVACGTCVAVCPTGALIERRAAYQGNEKNLQPVQSICVGCSVGCGVTVYSRDNRLVRILGDWDAEVNGGVLCKVGRFLPMEEARERITTPMVKKNDSLQPATWEEAVAAIAAKMQPLVGQNGSGVAALTSTRLPVEAISSFKQIFSDGMRSDMVTSMEEGRPTAAVSALAGELGKPFETNLAALESADCVIAAGVDLAESHQVAGFLVKRSLPNGTRLIVVNPAATGLDIHANVKLQATKGNDEAVLKGLRAGMIQLGLKDGDGVAATIELMYAAEVTGISEDDYLAAAGMLGTANHPVIVYSNGLTDKNSPNVLKHLIGLCQLAGASLLSVKGDANSLAAAQLGLEKPFELNGHQAVYVALGDDTPSQRLIQRLEKAPFLAVQASYVSRITAMADVVLPVEMWAEQQGHFVNLEGRVQESKQVLTPPENVRSNAAALEALAKQLELPVDANWQAALCARPAPVVIGA